MKNDNYISNLLGVFATTISTRIEQGVADLGGHSLSHEAALVAIHNHPDNSIGVLSKVLGLTHSGAVRLINTLEKEMLVQRYKCKNDARAIVLRTTPKGEKKALEVLRVREKVTDEILGMLTVDEKTKLLPVLKATLSGLTNDHQDARRICRMCNEQICRPEGCPVESAVSE